MGDFRARIARFSLASLGLIFVSLGVFGCGAPRVEPAAAAVNFERRAGDDEGAHGQRLYTVLACVVCHAPDLTGQQILVGQQAPEPDLYDVWAANLTRSAQELTDGELAAAIREGVRPDRELIGNMPSWNWSELGEDDATALVAFIRSRPLGGETYPPPVFTERFRALVADGAYDPADRLPEVIRHVVPGPHGGPFASAREIADWIRTQAQPPEAGTEHALGRYIVRATCTGCHGVDLEGGVIGAVYVMSGPNLLVTAPAYEREEFHRLLRTGVPVSGRNLGIMSAFGQLLYSSMTDAEVDAIYDYLRAAAANDS